MINHTGCEGGYITGIVYVHRPVIVHLECDTSIGYTTCSESQGMLCMNRPLIMNYLNCEYAYRLYKIFCVYRPI